MVNKDGEDTKEEGRSFKRRLENTPDVLNTAYTERFDIAGRDWEDIDIARFDETKPGSKVEMLYALQGQLDLDVYHALPVAKCPHVLTIRAVAENIETPSEMDLKFWIDDTGVFRMEACS
jgi:hypothetical protein